MCCCQCNLCFILCQGAENDLFRHIRNIYVVHLFVFLLLSSPFKEEPSDVCEEEPHLRLCHGIHHQCHAHRSQSDAEERHGVAAPTASVEQASLHVHASG